MPSCDIRAARRSSRPSFEEARGYRGPEDGQDAFHARPTIVQTTESSTYILHHPNRLLRLPHKLILLGLNLRPSLPTDLLRIRIEPSPHATLRLGLRRVQAQPRILHRPPRPRREHDVGVQRRRPAAEEAALDLRVLRQPRLAHLLRRQRVLLQRGRERVLLRAAAAGVRRVQRLRARQRRPRQRVADRLGLRLGRWRRGQGRLRLGRRRGAREQLDLLRDGAPEVVEGFADVGRVVVGFVRVLRAKPWKEVLGRVRLRRLVRGGRAYVTCRSF